MKWTFIIALILIGYLLFKKIKKNNGLNKTRGSRTTAEIILRRKVYAKRYLERKKYVSPDYLKNWISAKRFIRHKNNLCHYVTWVERDKIKSDYLTAAQYFKDKTRHYQEDKTVGQFNLEYSNFDDFTVKHNECFVKSKLDQLKDYFDNIEGKKLDDQQRRAILTDEYSNLIIAGAGSGKTLTILGKVLYLIEKDNVKPENILLLSFTRKTVEELNKRLNNLNTGAHATTFHKLGYDIIKESLPNPPVLANENVLTNLIKGFLGKDIYNYPEALQSFVEYVAYYVKVPEDSEKFESLGEKLQFEEGIDLETLSSKFNRNDLTSKKTLDTIQGERVKSYEELIIANFLFLNGIKYEYESKYPYEESIYRPDFFLTDHNIYLEHFGVDENNRAKWLTEFNERKYIAGMQYKRELHEQNGTKLIETYSYYQREGILLDKLKEFLVDEGVEFSPKNLKGVYESVKAADTYFGNELNSLIQTFINLSKSRGLNSDSVLTLFEKKLGRKNEYLRQRESLFLSFVLPIFKKYDFELEKDKLIDFNDMINRASELVDNGEHHNNYQYIIVDEYQDISFSRFKLINSLRKKSRSRLICVGDDWQSIYRFAGSDISLFNDFEKYNGKYEKLLIEQTYRNVQSLIDISSEFIMKNPDQIFKQPISKKDNIKSPLKYVPYVEENLIIVLLNQIKRLSNNYPDGSILILGRHSFDIENLIKLAPSKLRYSERTGKLVIDDFKNLDITFQTVHSSKGMEADNVIILNLKNDLLGFPNKITDDPILSNLLAKEEGYSFAEERRLFYVALTRTKNEVVLMIPANPSLFINDIYEAKNIQNLILGEDDLVNCPYCKSGHLKKRKAYNSDKYFLGCSNFPGCEQTFNKVEEILNHKLLCPRCKSGFMVQRKGKKGAFLGCTNFPKCRHTFNLK